MTGKKSKYSTKEIEDLNALVNKIKDEAIKVLCELVERGGPGDSSECQRLMIARMIKHSKLRQLIKLEPNGKFVVKDCATLRNHRRRTQ